MTPIAEFAQSCVHNSYERRCKLVKGYKRWASAIIDLAKELFKPNENSIPDYSELGEREIDLDDRCDFMEEYSDLLELMFDLRAIHIRARSMAAIEAAHSESGIFVSDFITVAVEREQATQKGKLTETCGGKITKEEANVRARELLKENPNYPARQLAEKIPCSVGLVSELPAWKALQEYKKKTFGSPRPKIIPLTKELEACLGSEDDQLQQLFAEQEKDQRQDARQARLYLSHDKRPKRGSP